MYELITKYFYGEITAKEKKLLFTAMETDAELKKSSYLFRIFVL